MEANASVDILDKEHRLLVQTKIKDSLSSFVQDIPGMYCTPEAGGGVVKATAIEFIVSRRMLPPYS